MGKHATTIRDLLAKGLGYNTCLNILKKAGVKQDEFEEGFEEAKNSFDSGDLPTSESMRVASTGTLDLETHSPSRPVEISKLLTPEQSGPKELKSLSFERTDVSLEIQMQTQVSYDPRAKEEVKRSVWERYQPRFNDSEPKLPHSRSAFKVMLLTGLMGFVIFAWLGIKNIVVKPSDIKIRDKFAEIDSSAAKKAPTTLKGTKPKGTSPTKTKRARTATRGRAVDWTDVDQLLKQAKDVQAAAVKKKASPNRVNFSKPSFRIAPKTRTPMKVVRFAAPARKVSSVPKPKPQVRARPQKRVKKKITQKPKLVLLPVKVK